MRMPQTKNAKHPQKRANEKLAKKVKPPWAPNIPASFELGAKQDGTKAWPSDVTSTPPVATIATATS
jgi:hypothetical protein